MTSLTCTKHYDELFECSDCGHYVDYQNQLISTNEHEPEGMCPSCRSDDVRAMRKMTVYAEVWVEESESKDMIIECAMEVDEWNVLDHTIRIKKQEEPQ